MKTTTKIGLLAVMLTTLVAGTQIASADETEKLDKEARQAIHQAVRDAVDEADYNAFVQATANSPKAGQITEDQFNIIVQAHTLKESGDKEAAKELLEQNGIERPNKKQRDRVKNPEARAAIEAGDFTAFQTAVSDGKRADLTEDQFNTLVQAHQLRQTGDKEGAKELLNEAGIESPNKGKHRGQNQE